MPEPLEITAPEPLGVRAHKVGPLIGAGSTKVTELIRAGILESVKIGRSRVVTMRSIKALIHNDAA